MQKQGRNRKITAITKLSYGTGNLVGSGPLALTGAWLLFFYTSFCGLSATQATLIFSVATYLDVILNPLMGFITDNFYKTKIGRKFGRRRFFILMGIPLMMVYPALWVTGQSFLYYFISYIAFEMVYTSIMIPYETLAVEMTDDFSERTFLTGSKAVFGAVANFLGSSIPGIFFALVGKNDPKSLFFSGLTYALIFVISLTVLYRNSWERDASEVNEVHTDGLVHTITHLFTDLFSTFRIKTFRAHIGMYLFGFGALWLFTAVFTYYLIFVLGLSTTTVAALNSMLFVIQFISTFSFIAICSKYGFAKPFIAASLLAICSFLGFIGLYFFHFENVSWLLYLLTAIYGFAIGGIYYIPWTTYTFLADVDEAVTNRRREGIYAGSMTMSGKLMRASVVFILGIILDHAGFVSGAKTQPVSAIHAIIGIIAIGVIGLSTLGIISALRYKLNKENHSILIHEVNRVHEGGEKEKVGVKEKLVMETLTGFSYDNLFGHNKVEH